MALCKKQVHIIISTTLLTLKLNRGEVSLLSIENTTHQTTTDDGLVLPLDDVQSYRVHLLGSGYQQQYTDWNVRCIQHLLNWMSANGIEKLDARTLHQFLHDGDGLGPRGFTNDHRGADRAISRYHRFLVETGRTQVPPEITLGGRVVEDFIQTLVVQGYNIQWTSQYQSICRHFVVWLYLNDIALADICDEVIEQFLSHDCTCAHPHFLNKPIGFFGSQKSRSKIHRFADYLISAGIADPRQSNPTNDETWQYLTEFQVWLQRYRGLQNDQTIKTYLQSMRRLLTLLGDDPAQYNATLIRDLMMQRAKTVSSGFLAREASACRMYLRFLSMQGHCEASLADAVPTVVQQKFSTLPRHLPQDDIEHIIATCDRKTPIGMRDYAILLLLARLALRAGDVANLRLKDIDWDEAVIRVSGKSRRETALPLPQDVGNAIIDYIRHARPCVDRENLFVGVRAPFQPISSITVSNIARAAIKRSGIKAEGLPAARLFRHSAATNMLRDGTPMEVISALLRHQSMETTKVYARVDARMLQAVAQPWPIAGDAQ